MTWNDVVPENPGPAGILARIGACLRIAILVIGTLVLFALYIVLYWLERAIPAIRVRHLVQVLWSRIMMRCCGLRMEVRGTPMKRGGAIVANHTGWIDILTMLGPAHITFVSKAEVRRWPIIGSIAHLTGTLFIERKQRQARAQQDDMRVLIEQGERLCFFPEGTSTDGLRVLPFIPTLFEVFMGETLKPHVWIQPVTAVYLAPDRQPASLYGWWGDMGFGQHVWTVMSRSWGGTVVLRFHDPVRAADFESRKTLALHCGNAVEAGMVEVRGYSLDAVAPARASSRGAFKSH